MSRDRLILFVRLTRPLDLRLIRDALKEAGAELDEVRMDLEHEEPAAA